MSYRLKISRRLLVIFMLISGLVVYSQPALDDRQFFEEEQRLEITVSTDINHLLRRKIKDDTMTAILTCTLPDGSVAREEIGISLRGNMRRRICAIPPVKFHFRKSDSSRLHRLKTLKLVNSCGNDNFKEQWLLREYIAYKIYNFLTEKSFRVRLLTITYEDIKDKKNLLPIMLFLLRMWMKWQKEMHAKN